MREDFRIAEKYGKRKCPNCDSVDGFTILSKKTGLPTVMGYCVECGRGYIISETQMTLKEVNKIRVKNGMKKLEKLLKPD